MRSKTWTSEEWLHVLMDDRKIRLLGRLPKEELSGPTRWINLDETGDRAGDVD